MFMSQNEKNLYNNNLSAKDDEKIKASYCDILKRSYVYAFCVTMCCMAFGYYSILTTIPFYMDEVLEININTISLVSLFGGLGGNASYSYSR